MNNRRRCREPWGAASAGVAPLRGISVVTSENPPAGLGRPWVVAPGVLIFLTVLAYNFLGDGLRDAADPKSVIVRVMKQRTSVEPPAKK